jgi:lysyl-tRNA synthetase class I
VSRLFLKKHSLVPYIILCNPTKKINKAKAEKIPFQKKIKYKAETGYKDIEISDFILQIS